MHDDLDHALAVAKVDEQDPAVVALVCDPPAQHDLPARMLRA
jgi:hypothetical protein